MCAYDLDASGAGAQMTAPGTVGCCRDTQSHSLQLFYLCSPSFDKHTHFFSGSAGLTANYAPCVSSTDFAVPTNMPHFKKKFARLFILKASTTATGFGAFDVSVRSWWHDNEIDA